MTDLAVIELTAGGAAAGVLAGADPVEPGESTTVLPALMGSGVGFFSASTGPAAVAAPAPRRGEQEAV